MNALTFTFGDRQIRTALVDGQPWFVASDAALVLGIRNVREILRAFPADEKGVSNTDTLGGNQRLAILNEAGLYRLIFQSRKPEAEKFKKWVFAEVLPALRHAGSYAIPAIQSLSPVAMARLHLAEALRAEAAGEALGMITPSGSYGEIAPNGNPRTGLRRAAYVAARQCRMDAAEEFLEKMVRFQSLEQQLELGLPEGAA